MMVFAPSPGKEKGIAEVPFLYKGKARALIE